MSADCAETHKAMNQIEKWGTVLALIWLSVNVGRFVLADLHFLAIGPPLALLVGFVFMILRRRWII